MDPNPDSDPDPATFDTDLSRRQQKANLKKVYLLIIFWWYIYIIFQIKIVKKKSQNGRDQGFSY